MSELHTIKDRLDLVCMMKLFIDAHVAYKRDKQRAALTNRLRAATGLASSNIYRLLRRGTLPENALVRSVWIKVIAGVWEFHQPLGSPVLSFSYAVHPVKTVNLSAKIETRT